MFFKGGKWYMVTSVSNPDGTMTHYVNGKKLFLYNWSEFFLGLFGGIGFTGLLVGLVKIIN